jgi:hypothetical protein
MRAISFRQRTVRPHAHPQAIQAARRRQETVACNVQDALRAGVESRRSPGIRRVELRRSRDLGWARRHRQQLVTATVMTVVRGIGWLGGKPWGERRRQSDHLAQLAPHPWSRRTGLC